MFSSSCCRMPLWLTSFFRLLKGCENKSDIAQSNPELAKFVEMCFEPGSVMNEHLKDTLVRMLSEVKR